MYLWAPVKNELADQLPTRYTAVHLDSLEVGLRFPLHSAISQQLIEWNITIGQIHPNGWAIILGILTLFRLEHCTVFPGTRELTSLIQIVERGEARWYHLKANNQRGIVESIPSKLAHWRNKFVFISGD